MEIKYRILSMDNKEHSMVVRYWTDLIHEDMLAINENRDSNGYPERCRTDYNLTIWKNPATEEDIIEQIKLSAPVDWFKLKEHALTETNALSHLDHLVGQQSSFEYVPPESIPQEELSIEEIEALLAKL